MKRPAVFFDRDNTLIASDGYLGDPAKVVLVSGAAAAVAGVRALGYATVVISNQSGVARGMFDEEAVRAVNASVDEKLLAEDAGAIIDRHEFCPYHPQAKVEKYRLDSTLRKPRPGMIFRAADAMALDLPRSWVVGDAPRDIEAGKAAGCRTILFSDSSLPASPATEERSNVEPDFFVETLAEAVAIIAREGTPTPESGEGEPDDKGGPRSIGGAANSSGGSSMGPRLAKTSTDPRPPRLEEMLSEVLQELRRRRDHGIAEFSVSKLLAGVLQVIVLAVLFFAYLARGEAQQLQSVLLLALTLQAMTIALLIMTHQK